MIDALRNERHNNFNGYQKRPETWNVDCGRVLQKDEEYLRSLTKENRIPMIGNANLNMSCEAIQERIHPESLNFKPLNSGGVAFARIVFMDYEFIEKQIQMSWHPENVFCFIVDENSSKDFQMKMKHLPDCLENIIVLPVTEGYDSNGHNQNLGHKRCMEELLPIAGWNYLLLLQNHDVVTKSVYELARIYELLDGANDVSIRREVDQRRVPGLKWDPKSMKLFRNESEIEESLLKKPMKIASGYVQASLSRAAVEWLIEKVDLTTIIDQFNQTYYAGDEQLIPSFQINEQFGMPGHFTDGCFEYEYEHDQITRIAQWASGDITRCATKTVRHGVCLIGIEEFQAVSKMPTIVFNKMMPTFDYSIVECTAELLFNRTFLGQIDHELDENYYENMLNVQYHKHRKDPGYKLNCTPIHKIWKYEDYI